MKESDVGTWKSIKVECHFNIVVLYLLKKTPEGVQLVMMTLVLTHDLSKAENMKMEKCCQFYMLHKHLSCGRIHLVH